MEEKLQKKLPARPNLEHLRGQAKALLAAAKSGDAGALAAFDKYHPTAGDSSVGLSDAQLVIARKHDFQSWPKLVRYVEQLTAMDGTWEFTALETDGRAVPGAAISRSRLIFNGDRFRMISPEATYEGIFDVDVEDMPHTIDIDFVEGPEAGNSSYGIYELADDTLTICLGFTGVARPTEFATKPGGGHALEKLRRTIPIEDAPQLTNVSVEPLTVVDREEFESMTPEHERVQGEWMAVEIIKDGLRLPTHFAKEGRRIGAGTLTTVKFGPQIYLQALTRIDASQNPIAIDYLHTSGSTEGSIQLGIMRWQGDDLQVRSSEPNRPRPQDFLSDPGSGHTLSMWRRKA